MRLWCRLALGVAFLCCAGGASASAQEHVVGEGQTLGKIAKRYGISIDSLCKANGIRRRDPIRAGQKLTIPDKDDKSLDAPSKDDSDEPTVKASLDAPTDRNEPDDHALGGGLRQIDLPGAAP